MRILIRLDSADEYHSAVALREEILASDNFVVASDYTEGAGSNPLVAIEDSA